VAVLAPHREELVGVVVESTFNGYWLVDGLMAAGYRVHVANTTAINKYEGLKYSGDIEDAAYLAQLLRLGLLPEGYIYPREERAGRDLGRKRMQLVRCRTAQILAMENLLARQTGGRMSSNQIKRLTSEQIDGLGLAPDVALALKANLAISDALQKQIEGLEKRLQELVRLRHDYGLLKSVPGIGQTLATTIMLETGTVARFARVGNFSSYCRCVDSVRKSNGKKKGEGNTKNGNKYLAWAFVEAANFAVRFFPTSGRNADATRKVGRVPASGLPRSELPRFGELDVTWHQRMLPLSGSPFPSRTHWGSCFGGHHCFGAGHLLPTVLRIELLSIAAA
jgi:transposase